jgi:hypothetical protein
MQAMNKPRHALFALLAMLGLGSLGHSQTLELIEGAYELRLGNVTFPRSIADSLIFRSCDDCAPMVLRIDTDTQFSTSEGILPLPDFLDRAAELAGAPATGSRTPLTVYYDLATLRATRVRIHDDDS